ncbi:acyl-CoA dehydrogenase family protein [Pseudomonas sp. RIT-PI-AD]|uniref:acyl-CoA dehydrogenase family protein n=1 Tax=Pseudomonas sp. RIT-PI-AD TaxID=3035294 RepID=UPI0021DA10D3|nr:acyl-CoA dehydrogenase family protein [Pseudomonas sp. RIT-PI-AD]
MPWQASLGPLQRLAPVRLDDWYAALRARAGDATPLRLALLGGRLAATPGLAFLAGYQAALRALWPSAPASLGAFCVTERRSLRPADLETRLEGLSLNGRKDFVSAADAADWLLVAAREDAPGEAPRLALCVVRNGSPGVRLEALPALPLMPDIGHARLYLEGAHCERLAGDGWSDYAKPFRTLEDLYVLAALVAWLYGVGLDAGWPEPLRLRLIALLGGCAEGARQCPSAAGGHMLLAGLFAQFQALHADLDAAFAATPAPWPALWQRDRGLLGIAATARERRLEKAREALGLG